MSDSDPDGTVNNSELELAGLLGHKDVLAGPHREDNCYW